MWGARENGACAISAAILLIAWMLSANSSEFDDAVGKCNGKKDLQERIKCYRKLPSLTTLDIDPQLTLAVSSDLFFAKYYSEATRLLDHYFRVGGDKDEAYLIRGMANSMLNNVDAAIADLTRTIELGRRDEFLFSERGRLYAKKGEYALAIQDYTKELVRIKSFELYELRGDAYSAAGNVKQAIADYREALELRKSTRIENLAFSPTEVELYLKLLELLRTSGRTLEYSNVRKEAIRRNPGSDELRWSRNGPGVDY